MSVNLVLVIDHMMTKNKKETSMLYNKGVSYCFAEIRNYSGLNLRGS